MNSNVHIQCLMTTKWEANSASANPNDERIKAQKAGQNGFPFAPCLKEELYVAKTIQPK